MVVSRDGTPIRELRLVKVSDFVCETYASDGARIGSAVQTPCRGLRLTDAQNGNVVLLSADQIAAARHVQ